MSDALFSIYPARIVHGGGQLNLTQLAGFDYGSNTQASELTPGGSVDRAFVGVSSASPQFNFTTKDLLNLLGAVSLSTGLKVTGSSAFNMQQRDSCSTFKTSADHNTYTFSSGYCYVKSISASQGQDVEASSTVLPFSTDGITQSVVRNIGVSLFGSTPAFNSCYELGPVGINGTQIKGITGWNVDTGIDFHAPVFNGEVYPKAGYIRLRNPVLSFTSSSINSITGAELAGRALAGTLDFYAWKKANKSTRVDKTTAGHLKISAADGMERDDSISVQGNDDGTTTINIMPTGALSISLTSTIPF